ncbi:MAG: hypothetical protein KKB30_10925 [Proteobacteria bacterium]|nr:hypothetical protein [Pseudomonadota bacterium]MBU1714543.1 hypothetical protein [Pseudomonadota bacterium]
MQTGVIDKRTLANGTVLSVIDNSRKIAGDRWLVEINCLAEILLSEDLVSGGRERNPDLDDRIMNKMAGKLVFSLDKKRYFVADNEKQDVMNVLVSQIFDNILSYLGNPAFPRKLFDRRYDELRTICLLEQNQSERVEVEEEEGPADFSACFKD